MYTPAKVAIFIVGMFLSWVFHTATVRALMEYRTEQAGELPSPTFVDALIIWITVLFWSGLFVALPLWLVK